MPASRGMRLSHQQGDGVVVATCLTVCQVELDRRLREPRNKPALIGEEVTEGVLRSAAKMSRLEMELNAMFDGGSAPNE